MKYRVLIGFTSTKAYDIEADTEELATDQAYEQALSEDYALTFDNIEIVDSWEIK